MRIAVCGVWHVHAGEYTDRARQLGEVVGFYEPNDAIAEDFLRFCPIHRFSSLEELLASDAEGVIVCSATSEHRELMIRIADSGKHIFTEKVLALTSEDAQAIADAVERNGVQFVISLPQKYTAPQKTVKAVADSGEQESYSEKALRTVLDEMYSTGGEGFTLLTDILSSGASDKGLEEAIKRIHTIVSSYPFPQDGE